MGRWGKRQKGEGVADDRECREGKVGRRCGGRREGISVKKSAGLMRPGRKTR